MVVLVALFVLLAAGGAMLWRGRAAAARRAAMLRPCLGLLAEPAEGRDGAGFPTVDGRFKGLAGAIRMILEVVDLRRLPQLWLSVSVHAPTGQPATLDVLRRVAGAEFYAPADDLPRRLPAPEGLPGDAYLRGTRGAERLLTRLAPHLAQLLTDARVKEVLVTPRGVRIVSQLCEGERGAYLLLRESRFALTEIAPATLVPHLARAAALARLVTREGGDHAPGTRAAA